MSDTAAPLSEKIADLASVWMKVSVVIGIIIGFIACALAFVSPAIVILWLAASAIFQSSHSNAFMALMFAAAICWLVVRDPVP